jgi:hypothetical protein
MFCCLQDFGKVPYIVPLIDLGRLTLRVLKKVRKEREMKEEKGDL